MCLTLLQVKEESAFTYNHPYHKFHLTRRPSNSKERVLKVQLPKLQHAEVPSTPRPRLRKVSQPRARPVLRPNKYKDISLSPPKSLESLGKAHDFDIRCTVHEPSGQLLSTLLLDPLPPTGPPQAAKLRSPPPSFLPQRQRSPRHLEGELNISGGSAVLALRAACKPYK